MRRLAAPALMIAMLLTLGCVAQPPAPEDVYYRLPPPRPNAMAQPLVDRRLGVGTITAAGPYNERAMIYVDAGHSYELHHYHYHYWMSPPPRLIREHLLDYLRAAGAAPQVVRYEPGDQVAALIKGRLIRFDREVAGPGTSVTVAIEFDYRESPKGAHWNHEYSASRPARDATMGATVKAFDAALEAVYESLLQDIRRALPAST